MAITLDNSTGCAQSAAFQTTITKNFTVGNGSNRLLVAGFGFWQGTAETVGVTYNGVSMQLVNLVHGGYAPELSVYIMKNPPTGAYNVVATADAAMESAVLGVASFFGVDQTTPTGSIASASAATSPAAVTINSSVGEVLLSIIAGSYGEFTPYAASAGQTAFMAGAHDFANTYSLCASYKSALAGNNYLSYTTPAVDWEFVALALKADSGVVSPTTSEVHALLSGISSGDFLLDGAVATQNLTPSASTRNILWSASTNGQYYNAAGTSAAITSTSFNVSWSGDYSDWALGALVLIPLTASMTVATNQELQANAFFFF
jgi:hypothetical protein